MRKMRVSFFFISFIFLFPSLFSASLERRAVIIARKGDNSHVHFLENNFHDPSIEVYIVNKIPTKEDGKNLIPNSYEKLGAPPNFPVSSLPWLGFSMPKGMYLTIYNVSEPKHQGRECAAYLYFIIRHYHNLPDVMLFGVGTPQRKPSLIRKYFDDPESEYQAFSGSMIHRCFDEQSRPGSCYFRTDFQKTLSEVGIDPPQCMTNWCCNNFIVHKSRVLQHPLSHYHHLLDFVIQERKGEAGWKHGCFYLEHAWHLLFGEPADMYLLRSSTQLNGDCMIGGNEYDDNPERPNPFNREPYLWLKH